MTWERNGTWQIPARLRASSTDSIEHSIDDNDDDTTTASTALQAIGCDDIDDAAAANHQPHLADILRRAFSFSSLP